MLIGEQQHGGQLRNAGCMATRQNVRGGTQLQSRATSTSQMLAVEHHMLAHSAACRAAWLQLSLT